MVFLYNIAIACYYIVIKLASFFNEKASLWIEGRKNVFIPLEKAVKNRKGPLIWMHCASLGEFEQGRPILESLRNKYPRHFLLLTFFSPSGYEIQKEYPIVDYVTYLPLDTKQNAKRFLDIVQPSLAIFVKYEFWFHFLTRLQQLNTPSILVSAVFRKNQHFFKAWTTFFKKMLYTFSHIFVQDKASKNLLEQKLRLKNVSLSGDNRVDRVMAIAKEAKVFPKIESFIQNSKVLVAGSTWPKDESVLKDWYQKTDGTWKLILAPHDIQERRLQEIENLFADSSIRYSQLDQSINTKKSVLIIDNIGMLSALYRVANLAYVGGGFGAGIHSILEPAAYGLPIFFGPKYHKFREAKILIERGGAFTTDHLEEQVNDLLNEKQYEKCKSVVLGFMQGNAGATTKVMKHIKTLVKGESAT